MARISHQLATARGLDAPRSVAITATIASVSFGVSFACAEHPAAHRADGVHEQRTQSSSYRDQPYPAKVVTYYRDPSSLPDLDVRALAFSNGALYAGTASGLVRLRKDSSAFEQVDLGSGLPVTDLWPTPDGLFLVIAQTDRVHWFDAGGSGRVLRTDIVTTSSISSAVGTGDQLYLGTASGLIIIDSVTGAQIRALPGTVIRDVELIGPAIALATDHAVLRYEPATRSVTPLASAPALPDDDVRAVRLAEGGSALLAASATGLARIPLNGGAPSIMTAGEGGLPNGDLTSIAERGGEVLTGHKIGATASSGSRREHYHSLRWILDEQVTAVALGPDRSRWIATHKGITRIHFEPDTLEEKAAALERRLESHRRMDGFVDDFIVFDDPWDQSRTPLRMDNDNDGLWTEMQVGAWCLAYATTKDERYYRNARRAMDVMMLEFDVPAATFTARGLHPGFITRSLVRDDETELFAQHAALTKEWHLQELNGHSYYWKDTTSSDEYAGHFFGIPLYYDLCAKTEAERAEIRKRVRSAMDYLIKGKEVLLGLDGQPTMFGHWENLGAAADGLDACTERYGFDVRTCVESYYGGGWLNSLEILGHLLATWHITGDQKYYDEYERLFTKERYGKMIPIGPNTWTVNNPQFVNHSDHELAVLAYYPLLRYEPNPARRELVQRSILDFYEYVRPEHNPFEVAAIASVLDRNVDLGGAIETMMALPADMRDVLYDNDHRRDAGRGPNGNEGGPRFSRVLPYDEIRVSKWSYNPYEVSGGSYARVVYAPTPYLISYWMMRYHGLITPAN